MAQQKRIRRKVNGILILDKPLGLTSNAALQKVRWLLNAEKAGHTGSLDPLATGVLPLCFGEATKFSQYLLDSDKAYVAELQLGVVTTTGDAEGEVLERNPLPEISAEAVEEALSQFRGQIQQIPPMYSALKRDGQPLYKLARAGEVVERAPRAVCIHHLQLQQLQADRLTLEVQCSKGTYIRTLVEDLGRVLGCGAHVICLRRTQAGPFTLSQGVTLEYLEALREAEGPESLDKTLLPIDSGLQHWALLELSEHSAYYWLHGQPVWAPGAPSCGLVRVQDPNGRFLGIGAVGDDGRLAPKRLIRST